MKTAAHPLCRALVLVTASCSLAAHAQLFTYAFDDVSTFSGRSSVGGTANNLTFSSFTATNTLSANSNTAGVFAFGSWVAGGATDGSNTFTGSPDATEYLEFTVTPGNGFQYSLSSISLSAGRTSTGPRQFVVRSSADNYTSNLAASATSPLSVVGNNIVQLTDNTTTNLVAGQSITLSSGAFSQLTSALTFRIFAFNAEGAGQFRLDNVAINGAVSAVPEPAATAALAGLGALLCGALARRNKKSSAVRAEDRGDGERGGVSPSA